MIEVPADHAGFVAAWERDGPVLREMYASSRTGFVPNLLPSIAVALDADPVLDLLRRRYGAAAVAAALGPGATDPERPSPIPSPVASRPDGNWLRTANIVGINVRTVRSFWNVVKYLLTVPSGVDSVHLLPIWEPGVVDSLYGVASWHINDEFHSAELAGAVPHLDTVERQLKAVVNLIHLTGRTVGMDVIPHTDRFSEMSLANPAFFEWLRRDELEIVDHSDRLHDEVADSIWAWLEENGPASPGPPAQRDGFFELPEEVRIRLLFGDRADRAGRFRRRAGLVRHLNRAGYEPVPATMGTPFRDLVVDDRDAAVSYDAEGNKWRDFLIRRPRAMSRVFNPLARYQLYGRVDGNRNWEIDFTRPRPEVWEYVCERYAAVQRRYGFDFMRGDMSHVQMRPDGVPAVIDEHYDLLAAVKNHIRRVVPSFGYFAESFLPPRDVFGYGEELDHLEAADAEVTQGDLQSTAVGTPDFVTRFRQYLDLGATRRCLPAFTLMTPDKDDPRFDEFYAAGNEVRAFIAAFLADVPTYVALGFETRDRHDEPWPNEHYTKLFVFHEHGESNVYPSKARRGDRYLWGENGELFATLTRLRLYTEEIGPALAGRSTRWLLPPDARADRLELAWTQADRPEFVFVANLATDRPSGPFGIPALPDAPGAGLDIEFTTATPEDTAATWNGSHYRVERLEPGEGRVYRVDPAAE